MDFLDKLRNLTEFQRKLILWSAVVVVAAALFIFWVRNVRGKLEAFQFQAPELPGIEMPQIELPENYGE